ncbi:hypothetical protein PF008_g19285 [Phytophthora fragariae]|uniref:Uncharacterized protein n=1 Tax=Phytophthora fragariae TaxID=53985 RepID=A0A6G0R346_9STRA|nr:hypothetical protein PF008_g19285 [Phytophthora fragariae]
MSVGCMDIVGLSAVGSLLSVAVRVASSPCTNANRMWWQAFPRTTARVLLHRTDE